MRLSKHSEPVFSGLVVFCVSISLLQGSALRAEGLNIYFKTTPRVELLRPFADPVSMSLLITGADGRPVKQGVVDIRLDAPKPGRIFSTDFPLVEGTRLSEMRLSLRQGKVNWVVLLPIRGKYQLAVDAITADGKSASKIFVFTVRENEKKWFILGGFSLGLLFLGFAAGRIFTQSKPVLSLFVGMTLLSGSAPCANAQRIASGRADRGFGSGAGNRRPTQSGALEHEQIQRRRNDDGGADSGDHALGER